MTITKQEKLDCARRELALRRAVYPKAVARGKMRRSEAEREIQVMEAIATDYADATDLFPDAPRSASVAPAPEADRAAGRPPHSKRGSR